jgi:AcrR family transcriptional regulator
MPRVSEAHKDARRAQISSAAAALFARQGFHSTSMADIIAESGLSAGAVYTYFKSKDELIAAVAETALAGLDHVVTSLLDDDKRITPGQATAVILTSVADALDAGRDGDLGPLVLQIWAEAASNPALAARVEAAYRQLREGLGTVVQRWQGSGALPHGVDPEQAGAALLALLQGYLLQRVLIPGTTLDGFLSGADVVLARSPRRT